MIDNSYMNKLKLSRRVYKSFNLLKTVSYIELPEPIWVATTFVFSGGYWSTCRVEYSYEGWKHEYRYQIFHRNLRHMAERKQWYNYIDQMSQSDLQVNSQRRCPSNIPNPWDLEKYPDFYSHHDKSWKCHTKCRKQWEKNL